MLATLLLVGALGPGCCSPEAPTVLRPIRPQVEPPDRRPELLRREAAWVYFPDDANPETVTLPWGDLELILKDRDDWRTTAWAYRHAVLWREDDDHEQATEATPPPEAPGPPAPGAARGR